MIPPNTYPSPEPTIGLLASSKTEYARLASPPLTLRRHVRDSCSIFCPVGAAARDSNLQACGGRDVRFAQQLGADGAQPLLVPDYGAPQPQ
jgi:hypothetical protein